MIPSCSASEQYEEADLVSLNLGEAHLTCDSKISLSISKLQMDADSRYDLRKNPGRGKVDARI